DLGTRPLAEDDAVADLEVERDELACLVTGTRTDGDHGALLGLLLRGVGNDDAPLRLLFAFQAANNDAVVQRAKFHESSFGLKPPGGAVWHSFIASANMAAQGIFFKAL